LQGYYKLIDNGMEHITKEWLEDFLVLVDDAKLSDPDIIGIPLITRVEHAGKSSVKKKKKKEEVQNIEIDEEDSASEGNRSILPGGGDDTNGKGGGDEGENQGEGEATPPKTPPIETPQKRKISLHKPSARKKTRASKPKMEATLTEDDISLVHGAMKDSLEDILQRYGAKKKELYEWVNKELKKIQQAIHSVSAVPTMPSSSKVAKLGDDPTQLRILADATKA
jgi:hypothetical protein